VSTELSSFTGFSAQLAKIDPSKIAAATQAAIQQSGVSSYAGEDILKMNQEGHWVRGMDSAPIPGGSQWIIHAGSLELGFTCWKGGKPEDEFYRNWMSLAENPLPALGDLPEHGPYSSAMEGWKEGGRATLVSADDPEDMVQYRPTNYGGRKAIAQKIQEIGQAAATHPQFVHPIVTLSCETYFNKNYNKDIATPVIDVVDWGSDDGKRLSEEGQPEKLEKPQETLDDLL
jgi:hypothetical protein